VALKDTANRLRADVQYLRDLLYISHGSDVTMRAASLEALLGNLTKTLIEIDAASGSSEDPVFAARMEAMRKRQSDAQDKLNAQANAATEALAAFNKPLSDGAGTTDPTTTETTT